MRKLVRVLTSRLFLSALLFAAEFSVMIYLVFWAAYSKGYYIYFTLLSAVVVLLVMTRNEKPAYKMVWMLLASLFPSFGGVLYLLYGNKKIGRLSEKKIKAYRIDSHVKDVIGEIEDDAIELIRDDDSKKLSRYIYNSTGAPAFGATGSVYFADGNDFFLDLLDELEKAEHFIFIEYFIIGEGEYWNRILEILRRKAAAGVDVRVMYDDMGSINSIPIYYYRTLRSYGIKAFCFNPVRLHLNPRLNFRDHRKIFSIDGNVCYTGGLNLADEYFNSEIRFGYWKDNAIKLTGSAVFTLTAMFLELWDAVSGQKDDPFEYLPSIEVEDDGLVQPFGFNPFVNDAVGENAYLTMIGSAKRYVWITTPYLIPDDGMLEALRLAAISGVDVRIITPHIPDKKQVHEVSRSNYDVLISSGVKIYEFTPGFVHSKMFLSDDDKAIVGTTNLDFRSFFLHFELSVAFYQAGICEEVKKDFLHLFELSCVMNEQKKVRIGFIRRAFRYFYKLFSPAL